MTIRLATAPRSSNHYVAQRLAAPRFATPVNDNRRTGSSALQLRAALLHFAAHGLAAADTAHAAAIAAHQAGDTAGFRHWLDVCRTLNQRKAAPLEGLAPGAND